MGIRNYLIEGGSGTGKTAVAEELERRGYHVIHGDRQFAYYGDPETGDPLRLPPGQDAPDPVAWYGNWIWPVAKVRALVQNHERSQSFFCGTSRNSDQFIDLFDAVFVLRVDRETLNRRLAGRSEDEFGGRSDEKELIVRLHETRQDIPKDAVSIDSTLQVGQVVDEIPARCTDFQ